MDAMELVLRENGFKKCPKHGSWSRETLAQAGLCNLTIRRATERERDEYIAQATPELRKHLLQQTGLDWHCHLVTPKVSLVQVRSADKVIQLVGTFVLG